MKGNLISIYLYKYNLGSGRKERKLEEAHMSMLMGMHMRDILLMESERVREYIHGAIRAIIRVIG